MIISQKIKDITYEFDTETRNMRVYDCDQFENVYDINDIKTLINLFEHLNASKLM